MYRADSWRLPCGLGYRPHAGMKTVNRRASIRSEDLFFYFRWKGSPSQHPFPLSNDFFSLSSEEIVGVNCEINLVKHPFALSNAFFSLGGRKGCSLCNEVLGEVWMRSRRVWKRSSREWMRSSKVWMRSSRVE